MNPATNRLHGISYRVLRSIYLLNNTVVHNDDSGTKSHSLCLVMGYVDDGCAQSLMKLGDLDTHLYTKLCVQVGKRFVHKEYLRITNDRTSHGNTLSLTTGKSLRLTIQKICPGQEFLAASRTFLSISSFGTFRSFRPNAMLSYTVICGYRA